MGLTRGSFVVRSRSREPVGCLRRRIRGASTPSENYRDATDTSYLSTFNQTRHEWTRNSVFVANLNRWMMEGPAWDREIASPTIHRRWICYCQAAVGVYLGTLARGVREQEAEVLWDKRALLAVQANTVSLSETHNPCTGDIPEMITTIHNPSDHRNR